MDPVVEVALLAVAAWAWAWLTWVARRDLPAVIYAQQNFGLRTPRPFYRLARRWRWVAAVGLVAVGAAAVVPESRSGVALGLLAVAVGLLTYAHRGVARFLDPRVVEPVLRAMRGTRGGDGPDEPLPAA